MTRIREETAVGISTTDVPVDEPAQPRRIRRPADATRFLLSVAIIGLILLIANVAKRTTSGLETDIVQGAEQTPHALLGLANLASGFGVLAVPVAFAAGRLLRRDGLRIVIGVLAAVVALGVSLALDTWINVIGIRGLATYLTWPRSGGWFPGPAHIDITPVIAFVTAVRLSGRPRWQTAIWTMVGLDVVASLVAGYITPLTVVTTYLIGRTIGYGVLYATGAPNTRPSGRAIVTALRRVGLDPAGAVRTADGPEETRRYRVTLIDDEVIDVTVLDRDQQAAGLLYRLWQRARLRGGTPRRTVRSLRRSLEQESLMAYAAYAAGARTPRLLATTEVGSDAALLAYEHLPDGRPLDTVPTETLTDETLTRIWAQIELLQARCLAHRRLVGESILLDGSDRPYLTDLRAGETAAGDLVLRLDLAQLLTDLALRVGPRRAVRTAADVLGADALAGCLPLLQKVALARSTRAALRGNGRGLLSELREQITALEPRVGAEPVTLDRFRPRTLISIIGGTAGAYFLLSQLSSVNVGQVIISADWRWLGVGALASASTYVGAAFMLTGFVPERLAPLRTVVVQVAGSFVKLVAPAAVSGVAVNTRYLQRAGVPTGQAAASVGASQLTGMGVHVLLLLLFGYLTGSHSAPSLPPSRLIIIVLLSAAVLATAVTAIGPIRRLVVARARSLLTGVVPRLLDMLQSPKKICTGIGGSLLVTGMFIVCLDVSIRAFGASLAPAAVAVVFLTGNAVGSAVPTPGGLGAVEGALSLGLTLAGLPAGTATSAVLLFRLLTFWVPVLPGWAAFSYLQRHEVI